jgi:hypothetical protein
MLMPLDTFLSSYRANNCFFLMLLRLSESSSNFACQFRSLMILATRSSLVFDGDNKVPPLLDLGVKDEELSSAILGGGGFSCLLGFGLIRVRLL